ncbi:MAG: hypothetical protein CVT79_08530 [Alphaproteobacteria bacterium HGW-Alphaproteobacteria-18]|nr:MAG: hypothetical protein CVT79_08530 [Alphaproteobacteria bacterium HGW-Alphaproteobacteria-18]
MKKLLASCAVVALMASPAIAQSTIDPTSPDAIPVEPMVSETTDPMDEFQPQTDVLPGELPPEPDMAEEIAPPTPGIDPVMQAEAEQEDDSFAETESDTSFAEAEAEADAVVTAEVVAPDVALEASLSEGDLPEEYSTEDLNAQMLAAVNTVGAEISELDAQADVWVTADGSPVDPAYAQEGQGDMDVVSEEAPVTDGEYYMTPEADDPDSSTFIEPGLDPVPDDTWNENPVSPEDPSATEY